MIRIVDTKEREYFFTEEEEMLSRSKSTGKVRKLKMSLTSTGYYRFIVNNKDYKLHRLLAEQYVCNPENKPHVNHIDGDKLNNNLGNLEWCTHAENMKHAADTGLTATGTSHGMSKLTEEDVKTIRTTNKPHKLIRNLLSVKVSLSLISQIKNGLGWKEIGVQI